MASTTEEQSCTHVPDPAARSKPWQWVLGAVILGLIVLLYATVLADLVVACWSDSRLSQGLLIPPIVLYLTWLRSKNTFRHPVETDGRGLWLIALGCVMFVAGKLGAELFLPRMSFVVLLAGLIWTFWGRPRLRTLLFPLVLLATMVPIPMLVYNALSGRLQLLASTMATWIAQHWGVALYQDGNIIHLPGISFGIEEACNGLNSLSALVVTSLLLGYLLSCRLRTRALLLLLSLPLSIAVNIVRVAGTAIIASHNEEYAMGFYHAFSGWLVFLVGFSGIYGSAMLLNALVGRRVPEGAH